MKKINQFLIALLVSVSVFGQEDNIHQRSSEYQKPDNPEVLEKLDKWQDQKFGMLIHWGLYAVPGIMESWTLCSEDWIDRPPNISYNDYKKWYWNLNSVFDPVNFDPDGWAEAAEAAGMKYVVFTTKHHDGFNMFDTKQTDFKITNGPFQDHPKANIVKYVFEAFRKKDFMIGAYYSKPDWHNQDFWWDKYATPNRNVNYDIREYPEKWKSYQDFTFNQIQELMTGYGGVDVLWLDGGWIRPKSTVNDEVRAWGAPIPEFSQEINMDSIAEMARKAQPGLIIADRTVQGPYENYQTPERRIPDSKLDNPWESCLPFANNWGYVPNDEFKSVRSVIHSLVETVAKGGNMLLGVGPTPDGIIPLEVVKKLEEIGAWLDVNGEAIYGTRAMDHYQEENAYFTKKDNQVFAIVLQKEGENLKSAKWTNNVPTGNKLKLVGFDKSLKFKNENGEISVVIPNNLPQHLKNSPALVFSFKMK
ncbi:alpha-L-fucosidase [Autumnicola musiva]|uniref:alpha-L-fucosidase n=1 Tax=Autumnicola musiva TaxID=3075589 RepID=A0ABU3D2X7_9FLAO|nr:alpha-L-fucosidase [Zunongwangia sp. F117]MDT0675885.1 alpha-L-fucosidase [Zunongwangia sp. F117]